MPEEVLATLETLLAPGGRSRLSPYVEDAQYWELFRQMPEEGDRARSERMLLDRHGQRIREIAQTWARLYRGSFDEGTPSFDAKWYAEPGFLNAYLIRYFSRNVLKVQVGLLELLRRGRLVGDITLLDIGVGTAATAIAALDFLLAWNLVCDLYGVDLPVTGLRLFGVDRNPLCLDYAKRVVAAYASALNNGAVSRQLGGAFARVGEWAAATRWIGHDLERGRPVDIPSPSIVAVADVLNELAGC